MMPVDMTAPSRTLELFALSVHAWIPIGLTVPFSESLFFLNSFGLIEDFLHVFVQDGEISQD